LKISTEEFPNSSNTHNTIAWILARAARKLDVGIEHSKKSIELSPFEAAYIDTMGELWFAKQNRAKAIEWGEKAVISSKYGRLDPIGRQNSARARTYSLVNQLERFRSGSFPKQ